MSESDEIRELYDSIQPMDQPPPGSWAAVARLMASGPQDPNEPPMDWDQWKDEMKENE